MKNFFICWWKEVKILFFDWHYMLLLGISLFLFWGATAISWHLSEQNDLWNIAVPVGDAMFQVLPLWDLSLVFVGGAISMVIAGTLYAIFFNLKKVPLALLAFAFLVFFRGIIINATHIGLPVEHITPYTWGLDIFAFQNDLFFSGHTAGPFLAALLLWGKKIWRYFFLGISVLMAFTVLTMRLHYSIDIIGAYFITYGIFHATELLYGCISSQLKKIFSL